MNRQWKLEHTDQIDRLLGSLIDVVELLDVLWIGACHDKEGKRHSGEVIKKYEIGDLLPVCAC